jgi:two-component system sensor histidine kinase UhpB
MHAGLPSTGDVDGRGDLGDSLAPVSYSQLLVKPSYGSQDLSESPPATGEASKARPKTGSHLPLLWRVFGLSAAALVVAVALTALVVHPVLRISVADTEAAILLVGLAAVLLINLLVLRRTFAPLQRLAAVMRDIDLLRPGQPVSLEGSTSEVTELVTSFNEMLDRLEIERQDSARRALAAQEAERLRVARELHDEVGQSLTGVLLELARLERQARAELAADIHRIQESVRGSLENSRRIALELRPEALDDLGLGAALRVLTDRLSERAGIEIKARVERDLPSLEHEQELVIYRVAQEALTNVVRHASANHADLWLGRRGNTLKLRIRDDGCGLDGGQWSGGGIRGMHERALMARAALRVSDLRSGGVEVTLDLPLETPT